VVSAPKIPTSYTITMSPQPMLVGATVNAGSDNIRIREIAPITIQPVTMTTTSTVGMNTTSRIEPMEVSLRVKEIPSVRVHMPMHYQLGFSVLGMEVLSLSLCGESMVITEPYQPNECELCRPARGRLQTNDRIQGEMDSLVREATLAEEA
jgi:hypothetical protein